jgi:hypothetical protein
MISITLRTIKVDGDERDYEVTPKVQVAFEREFKVGMGKAFQQDQKMEYVYWLAWKAAQSEGEVVKPFDGWLDTVRSVEIKDVRDPLSPEG